MTKEFFTLNNGVKIPSLGYGTWQIPAGQIAVDAAKDAIIAGYRHIDCAAIYENERSIARGIKEGLAQTNLKREDIFITSKLWNSNRGYENALKAFEKTCDDLGVDYLDLYLIHFPANDKQFKNAKEINEQTWQAFVELYEKGRIKAIGVSNFLIHHLEQLKDAKVRPMVNQVEFHPGWAQTELIKYCKENDILVEAWGPLGCGHLIHEERLQKIGAKYGASAAQVCIAWCLAKGTLPLPKSVHKEWILENSKLIKLENDDIEAISVMDNLFYSGMNPDEVGF